MATITARKVAADPSEVRPARMDRLHGHSLEGAAVVPAAAEFVGTFLLVMTICATATSASLSHSIAGAPYASEAVALAGGFVLAAVVAALGHVSGAHLNPGLTIGLAVTRSFPLRHVPAYLGAQFAGAVAAAAAVWVMNGNAAKRLDLGTATPAAGVSDLRVFFIEAVVTFLLGLVVVSVATDPRVPRSGAALAIGLALSSAIFISGPTTGAGVNPARAIGPMIVSGSFNAWWIYLLAPCLGATAAAALYGLARRGGLIRVGERVREPGRVAAER